MLNKFNFSVIVLVTFLLGIAFRKPDQLVISCSDKQNDIVLLVAWSTHTGWTQSTIVSTLEMISMNQI